MPSSNEDFVIRGRLRKRILVEGYDHYFDNNGAAKILSREEINSDKEVALAYQYLIDKGLVSLEKMGNASHFKPTVYGIDTVEA